MVQKRIIQRHKRTEWLLLCLLTITLINIYIVIKLRVVAAVGNFSIRAGGGGGGFRETNFVPLFHPTTYIIFMNICNTVRIKIITMEYLKNFIIYSHIR